MTENTENLVLEIPRKIQGDVASLHREVRMEFREIKTRLTLLEQHFATYTAMLANQSGCIATPDADTLLTWGERLLIANSLAIVKS